MALKYKMVCADFDSTSTNSKGEVTSRTREAVKKYRDAGGIFLVNTGRSYKSVVNRLKEIYGGEVRLPLACLQGGRIFSADGELIREYNLDKPELIKLVGECQKLGVYFQIYSGERLFAEREHEMSVAYMEATGTGQEFVGDMVNFLQGYDGSADKLLVISDVESIAKLFKVYEKDASFINTKFVYSTPFFLEAIPHVSGKDVALRLFADMYGVTTDEVAAIGDSNNDLPMIKAAGLGVAMGNAVTELKAAADLIAEDCDHDGLALFLESITDV